MSIQAITPQDVENEHNLAEKIKKKTGLAYLKMATMSAFDLILHKEGKVSFICELRERKNSSSDYSTVFIDQSKLQRLLECRRLFACPALFFVSWNDVWGFTVISPEIYETAKVVEVKSYWNRTTHEPGKRVMEIPIENFRIYND